MSKLELVTHQVYKATEKLDGYGMPRRVIHFKYVKTNYYGSDPVLVGVDLATGYTCSLFPKDWSFSELSSLELELL